MNQCGRLTYHGVKLRLAQVRKGRTVLQDGIRLGVDHANLLDGGSARAAAARSAYRRCPDRRARDTAVYAQAAIHAGHLRGRR